MYCLLTAAEHEPLAKMMCSFITGWGTASAFQAFPLLAYILMGWAMMKHSSIRKHIIGHLMRYACFVFLFGFALYTIGFNHEGSRLNLTALVFRAATASMEMFVSESELIEVADGAKDNPWYMSLFATTHFCAICISAAFILHIMGIRFWSYLKMRLAHKDRKDMYVFFDLSQESVSLAKDIYSTCQARKDKCQIIFVKTPTEESHLERFSFSHILSFADSRNETTEELIDIHALLTYSRKCVAIGMEDGMDNEKWAAALGLSSLYRYLMRCSSEGEMHFFCLSHDEDANINTAVVLNKRYPKGNVYCKANRDSITDSFTSPKLKFIDSANLAIMELKKNVAYQPVSFVKPDTKTAVATKPFRSMIVGFGETGFEAFRFLYEFSSFVGKDTEENQFYCDIIDPKARLLENSLYLHCPALEEKEKSHIGKTHIISFHEGTTESNRKTVAELIKTVDYIVVCTDDDKQNLSTGITLLDLAYKYRNNSDKLAVFVGINDNREFKKAQEIAKYHKVCGQRDNKGNLYDFTLVPFGAMKELFTYRNIIGDDVLDKAKAFYHEYQKTATLLDTKYEGKLSESPQQEWENRETDKEKDIYGSAGLYYKNELMQKEFQDIANAWHIKTKLHLAGACDCCKDDNQEHSARDRHEQLQKCIDTVMQKLLARMKEAREHDEKFMKSHEFILEQISAYEKEHDIPSGEFQTLFENLAKCEHLRWVASNRLLGYRKFENAAGNQKHYLQKTLACMVSCEDLVADEELRDTIKYDYNTIMTSLSLS